MDIKNFRESCEVYKIVVDGKQKSSFPPEITSQFYIFGSDNFFEFVNKDCVKENAIKKVLDLVNLHSEEAIAFGDEDSDVNMLKAVGCGVAVCNAPWEVKTEVKYITDSNNDDGVARALIKILN